MKNDYPHIFSPLTVKNMTIKNRIVMMPMGTNYGEQNGEMSFLHINYYEQRAKGGTGLIIVENASIDSPQGSNGTTQLRIDHDNYLPRLFKFCENIHRYGTKIAIQINHAGASAISSCKKSRVFVQIFIISFICLSSREQSRYIGHFQRSFLCNIIVT